MNNKLLRSFLIYTMVVWRFFLLALIAQALRITVFILFFPLIHSFISFRDCIHNIQPRTNSTWISHNYFVYFQVNFSLYVMSQCWHMIEGEMPSKATCIVIIHRVQNNNRCVNICIDSILVLLLSCSTRLFISNEEIKCDNFQVCWGIYSVNNAKVI